MPVRQLVGSFSTRTPDAGSDTTDTKRYRESLHGLLQHSRSARAASAVTRIDLKRNAVPLLGLEALANLLKSLCGAGAVLGASLAEEASVQLGRAGALLPCVQVRTVSKLLVLDLRANPLFPAGTPAATKSEALARLAGVLASASTQPLPRVVLPRDGGAAGDEAPLEGAPSGSTPAAKQALVSAAPDGQRQPWAVVPRGEPSQLRLAPVMAPARAAAAPGPWRAGGRRRAAPQQPADVRSRQHTRAVDAGARTLFAPVRQRDPSGHSASTPLLATASDAGGAPRSPVHSPSAAADDAAATAGAPLFVRLNRALISGTSVRSLKQQPRSAMAPTGLLPPLARGRAPS